MILTAQHRICTQVAELWCLERATRSDITMSTRAAAIIDRKMPWEQVSNISAQTLACLHESLNSTRNGNNNARTDQTIPAGLQAILPGS